MVRRFRSRTERATVRGTGGRGDWQEERGPEELEHKGLSVHPGSPSHCQGVRPHPDPQVLIVRIKFTYHKCDVWAAQ